MATRMQQRRGTAAQWTAADPVLAAGEMGFETDTNEFRIGDGVNVWSDLSPFKNLEDLGGSLDDYVPVSTKGQANGVATLDANGSIPLAQLASLIDDAPAALNTLGEIADLLTTVEDSVTSSLDAHNLDTTNVHGIADTSLLATEAEAESIASTVVATHNNDTTGVHGITDTSLLATTANVNTAQGAAEDFATGAISDHNAETENVHGIANTALLVTTSAMSTAITTHNDDTTSVHGIANTENLVSTTDTGTVTSTMIANGTIVDTDINASAAIAQSKISGLTSDLAAKAPLASPTFTGTVTLPANTITQSMMSDDSVGTNEIGGLAVTTAKIADSAVTSAKIADLTIVDGDISASAAIAQSKIDGLSTSLAAKADLAGPTFTGTVSGITKSMVGLGNVDNTTDAGKPVSTATQTALDLKANLAAPTFTGTVVLPSTTSIGNVSATEIGYVDGVTSAIQTQLDAKAPIASPTFTGTLTVPNLTVTGTTTTVNSTNLEITDPLIYIGTGNSANANDLGVVGHFDNGTYQHTGIVRDATDGKWKLFSGVTTEPTGTVDFTTYTKDALVIGALDATSATIGNVSNTELQYLDGVTSAIQTQIDAKSPTANPTFTGTVTVAASGVAFTDGTQTKEGVISRTPIIQKTDSYTLSALTERDSLIEVSKATAATVTVPLNSAVAYPVGTSIDILQTGAGQVSIVGTAGVTLNCAPSGGSNTAKLRTTWSSATLFKRATDTWVVFGDLTA